MFGISGDTNPVRAQIHKSAEISNSSPIDLPKPLRLNFRTQVGTQSK